MPGSRSASSAGATIRSLPRRVGPGGLPHLDGRVRLIIENQERHLRAWDFVHCPPMTAHTFVAKEAGPCVILATGNRRDDLERVCPRSEVALRYDAGSEVDTTDPERRGRWEVRRPAHWDELPWAERRSLSAGALRRSDGMPQRTSSASVRDVPQDAGYVWRMKDVQPQRRRVGRDEGPRGLARQGRARRPTHRR